MSIDPVEVARRRTSAPPLINVHSLGLGVPDDIFLSLIEVNIEALRLWRAYILESLGMIDECQRDAAHTSFTAARERSDAAFGAWMEKG